VAPDAATTPGTQSGLRKRPQLHEAGGIVAATSDKRPTETDAPTAASGRKRRRTEALQARARRVTERAQEERGRHGSLDAVFEIVDRDAEVAGGIIAGALAYRLFIWLLPLALVLVGGLGLFADAASDSPKDVAGSVGLGGLVAASFQESTKASWYALLVGVPVLLYATRSVLRVLIGTHRLVWGDVRSAAPKPTFTASAELLALILLCFLLAVLASWVRATSAMPGLVSTLAVTLGFAGAWLLVSLGLPHRDAGWKDLVPGALVVGIGLDLFQVLAAYLLTPYALAKQGTYGALGIAAVLLLGLFLLGRLMVTAAEVNATLWERRRRAA
jgi:uncharacterized BrkB/YihY/UPF0761 family membrane protein